jgi:hypothetical protein
MWIAFGPYFALMTWFFAEMGERYPGATVQLFIGNALSALAPVAAIFSIYGREAFEAATDLLSWMFKPSSVTFNALGGRPYTDVLRGTPGVALPGCVTISSVRLRLVNGSS